MKAELNGQGFLNGVAPNDKVMMYEGKRLEDFRCLKYYNIKKASQIYFMNG